MPDRPDLIKKWTQGQRARQRELASESLDIDPRLEIGLNMPYTNTIMKSQAYEEKLNRLRKERGNGDFSGWKSEVEENRRRMLALDDGSTQGRSLRDSTLRQQSVASSTSKPSTTLRASSASTADGFAPKRPPSSSSSRSGLPRPPSSSSSRSGLPRPPRPLSLSARSESTGSSAASATAKLKK
jgi:hypothetical protein